MTRRTTSGSAEPNSSAFESKRLPAEPSSRADEGQYGQTLSYERAANPNRFREMRCDEVPGGIRVEVETAALQRLARFVVGLGGSAKPLTATLEEAVAHLARGAMASIDAK